MAVSTASPTPELPGYEVLEPLDEGGMATLWLARRHDGARLEVIKRMRPEVRARPAAHGRFLREAELACRLDHPRLVRGLNISEGPEGPFLSLEYVPGCTLEAFRRRWSHHQVPPALAVGIVLQVLEGLEYAHALTDGEGQPLRFVHRDLSPRNVMIDFEGQVKLIDLGLARATLGDFKTEPGMICGTPRYMSPEQACAAAIDARSDLYTVAVVLYELLTGRPTAHQAGLAETLMSVAHDVPEAPRAVCPAVSEALDAVVRRALEKLSMDRYPNARAFADALRAAVPAVAGPNEIARLMRGLLPEAFEKALSLTTPVDLEDTLPTSGPRPGLLVSERLLDPRPKRPDSTPPAPSPGRRASTKWGDRAPAPAPRPPGFGARVAGWLRGATTSQRGRDRGSRWPAWGSRG